MIELLAELFDDKGGWTWGCNNTTESGYIHHRKDWRPLSGQHQVGPREWGESRLQRINADDGALLPDYLKPEVLPREAGGSLPYQQVTDNMKKQARLPFGHTERAKWLDTYGSEFDMMMKGDYGDGVQHLQFDIGDVCEEMDSESRAKKSLFQSDDIDSGMGWLPNLGAIRTDVKVFLYPFSSRNFDANIHLFMDIDGEPVRINDINHFLLGEFGNIGPRSCQLYLFLPTLFNQRSKGNGVEDRLKDTFVSRYFIPAAEEILGDVLLEQFGRGMREIKTDCEAAMYEAQIYGSVGSRLTGDVYIPQRFLTRLWDTCMTRLDRELQHEDEDLVAFKDCRLFWSFKGFKYVLAGMDDKEIEPTLETKVSVLTIIMNSWHLR